MALYRNIAGVLSSDVYTLKCDDGGCYDVNTDQVIESWRPQQGSGVFPPVEQYPVEVIPNNQPVTIEAPIVVNTATLPIAAGTPETPPAKKDSTGSLLLLGIGAVLYLGMTKKNNNAETALFAGGVAALYWSLCHKDKQSLPVTE